MEQSGVTCRKSCQTPGTTKSPKIQGRILPWCLQKEWDPADTWISAFWPPDLETVNSCCFKPAIYSNYRELRQASAALQLICFLGSLESPYVRAPYIGVPTWSQWGSPCPVCGSWGNICSPLDSSVIISMTLILQTLSF